ncbi:hypothetical protein BC835DRAFT_1419310 [Cytidiella melzeri]|nr:hypothetical protein BC835DRAFT_1419310 [Cytidiella melzeri]
MSSNFLGLYPKTSYRVFNLQAHPEHPSQARPQVVAGANGMSHMAVYQDAYRRAEAFLREKEQSGSDKIIVDKKVTNQANDHHDIGSETRLSEATGSSFECEDELKTVRRALAEATSQVETAQELSTKYEEKISQLTDTNSRTLSALEDARVVAEQHRRMSANLNVALMTDSAAKQALKKENSKLSRSLKEAEADKRRLQSEVVVLHQDKRTVEHDFEEATEEIVSLKTHLDDADRELTTFQAKHSETEATTVVLRSQIDTLSANYDRVALEKLSLERVLTQAQFIIEKEMTCASETLTTLTLVREKNMTLEQMLKQSGDLLIAANERVVTLESELEDLRDNEDSSDDGEFHFSASTFELELEREMYQSQEQEALVALEAEKGSRLATEKALDSCRKMLLESDALLAAANERTAALESELVSLKHVEDSSCDDSEFHFSASTFELELEREMYQSQEQEALKAFEAEKEARLVAEEALATCHKMLSESDALLAAANERTAALESELGNLRDVEDASDDASDDSEFHFSASTFELELEREMYRSQEQEALDALEAEKKARLAAEKDRDLFRENQQLAFAAVEQAAAKERAELATQLQVALTTITELASSVQTEKDLNAAIYAQLTTECDALARACDTSKATPKKSDSFQRRYLNFNDSNVPLAPEGQMTTPARFARADKENDGVVLQKSLSMRSTHFAFGDISMCDPPSLAWQPFPFQEAATQSFSSIDLLSCFTQSGVASEFTGDGYDGVTMFGVSFPALS